MDYTTSDAFATDAGTGNRLHQDTAAVTTEFSAEDANGVIWELLSVIKAKGLAPIPFDKTVPGSYTQVLQAIQLMIAEATQDFKTSVRFTTVGNIVLSGLGTQAGGDWAAPLTAGDRILPKNQAVGSENGIYIAAAGAWTRATDADGVGELTPGALVAVEEGATLADSVWELATDGAIIIGTTALTFSRKDSGNAVGASVQGTFKNLQASATGTNATVSVSYDELVLGDGAGSYITDRNAAGAINTTVVGAGGLDTGALAASTWYSVWRIGKTDGTRSWLISLSASAPTMPAGYTHKARVGWIRTDGTANKYPLSFKQYGRKVRYVVGVGTNLTGLPVMVSGAQGNPTGPTWVAFSIANFVPTTASILTIAVWQHTTNIAVVAPNNSYGAVGSTTNPPPLANTMGGSTGGLQADFTIESTNMYYMSNAATGGAQCVGWDDNF